MRWEFPSWSKGTLGVLGVHQLEEQQPMRLRHVNYSILFNIFQNAGFWWLYLVNRGYKTCMCPISGYCLFIDSTLRYIWSMLPTFVVFLWIAQFRGLRTECETWGIPRNQPAAIQKIAYSTRIDKFFARHQAPPAQCGRCCCEASAWHGDLRWPSQALPPDLTGSCGASGLATAADDVGTAAQWRCVTCVGSMGIPWKILRWKQRRFRRCKFIARISGGALFFLASRMTYQGSTWYVWLLLLLFMFLFPEVAARLDPARFLFECSNSQCFACSSATQPGFERNLDMARPPWSWMFFSQKLWEWKSPMFLWPFRHGVWTESLRKWI